jgi:tricorn protease
MRLRSFAVLCLAATTWLAAAPGSAQTKLLRFPDIHGDQVAFSYAGDIWLAPATGGTAVRLTAHPGLELYPKFSPDGQWIAFTGQYDGDEQVYVVPTRGGEPRQLTYFPAWGPLAPRWGTDNQVYDWTPDGKAILFRSLRYSGELGSPRLFTVSFDGGLPVPLPMPKSGAGDFSPDGKRLVYSPLFRDFRTWKRYQGGWAEDLMILDLATHDFEQVTNHPRTDRDPMWIGDKIYFASDRDGHLNLYVYDTNTHAIDQLTHSNVWDVRWPSDDGVGRIVYELNGELVVYDIAAQSSNPISIFVPDDGVARRPSRVSAADLVEDFALSPQGERALFVARGDVFTAPIEHGPTRNLTQSSGAHDKWARWSPDGSRIAFVSDRDGDDEVYTVAQDGGSDPEQLTTGGQGMRYAPEWSPDGARIAFSDKNGKLYVVDVASHKTTEIADDAGDEIRDYTWSPHGGHLAFSMSDANGFYSLYIWSAADGQTRRITSDSFLEFSPAWDPAGNYLFFLADRMYQPQISSIEFDYATDRETFLYAMALRKDVGHPFPPRSDEVTLGEKKEGDEGEKGSAKAKSKGKEKGKAKGESDESGKAAESAAQQPIRIDFDGLADRVALVPVEADNYGNLSAVEGHLVYVRGTAPYYGRSSDLEPEVHIFSMEDRKEKTLAAGSGSYALSADGKKMLVEKGSKYELYDVSMDGADSAKDVSTAELEVDRVPSEEWAEIFEEVWRRYRDFFYVDNMHGYDWKALHDQYQPQLAYVAHRSDLNYVIGEMIAELSTGHSYIQGGDWQSPERPKVALLGAELALDPAAGRYRIAKILAGDNAEETYRSPLTEVGVDVAEGDYLLAINGVELTGSDNPYRLLRYHADHPVELTVNSQPVLAGARKVKIEPLTDESDLRYYAWVAGNRARVEEETGGRVGYLHLPDMGSAGIREFIKWYYPQIRKEGLIVDVRGNGGGNVSEMVLERLSRKLLGTGFARNSDRTYTYPSTVFYGHMVCLLNEDSASDGDIFPYFFREAGLGPLIGKRSWGGVVGITGHGPLIDGGSVYVPEFSTNAVDGSWIIEGHGVDPDIVVENDPKSVLEGRDPQLERGIQEVMRAIDADPKRLPSEPPAPVKTP